MNPTHAAMQGELHHQFATVPVHKAVKLPSVHANYAIDYRVAGPRVMTKAPFSLSRRQKPKDMQGADYEIQLLRQQLAAAEQQTELLGSMLAMQEDAEQALSSSLHRWEVARSTLTDLQATTASASDLLHQRFLSDFADGVYMCGKMFTHAEDTDDYISQRQLSLSCLTQTHQQMSRLMVGSLKSIKDLLATDQLTDIIELCVDLLTPADERRALAAGPQQPGVQSYPITWEGEEEDQ